MAFVKLDTGILDSTLWIERDQREIFITALLMAEPREFSEPIRQIKIGELEWTGFEAPPGWYGFVPAASFGIINRAGVEKESGMEALRKLGDPESESRSKDFEGRRMIRMDGGFVVLNYMKYRDKDHTAAERQRRLRARRKVTGSVTRDDEYVTRDATLPERVETQQQRNVTQADADADASTKTSRAKAARGKKTEAAKSRHAEFKAAILRYWESKNPGVEMPWGPAEGRSLEMWLRETPNTTLEQFVGYLRNRFKSAVTHTERPSRWIGNVTNFASGPIDKYGKPLQESANVGSDKNQRSPASQRVEANLRAVAETAVRRGWVSADNFERPDAAEMAEPGPGGIDR